MKIKYIVLIQLFIFSISAPAFSNLGNADTSYAWAIDTAGKLKAAEGNPELFKIYWEAAKNHFLKAEQAINDELKNNKKLTETEKYDLYDYLERILNAKGWMYLDNKSFKNKVGIIEFLKGERPYEQKANDYFGKAFEALILKEKFKDAHLLAEKQRINSEKDDPMIALQGYLDAQQGPNSLIAEIFDRSKQGACDDASFNRMYQSLEKYLTSRGVDFDPEVTREALLRFRRSHKAGTLDRIRTPILRLDSKGSFGIWEAGADGELYLDIKSDPGRVLGEGGFKTALRELVLINGAFQPIAVSGAYGKNNELNRIEMEREEYFINKIQNISNKTGIIHSRVILIKQPDGSLRKKVASPLYEQGEMKNVFKTIDRNLNISEKEALRHKLLYFNQMLQGVVNLHHAKILHSDLKKENVLVNDRETVINDFGLAVDLSKPENLRGPMPCDGTPGYLSPECLSYGLGSGDAQTKATRALKRDVFAVGVMLADELFPAKMKDRFRPTKELAIGLESCEYKESSKGRTKEEDKVKVQRCYSGVVHQTSEQLQAWIEDERTDKFNKSLLKLAMDAIQPDPDRRPTSAELLGRLQQIQLTR